MLAGTVTVNCVAFTKVVGVRFCPFHCTIEPETKLEPLTMSWNAWLAGAVAGLRPPELIAGSNGCALMVKDTRLELAAPGLRTPMNTLPGAVSSAAGTSAVKWELSTKMVASAVGVAPATNCTTDPATKLVPTRLMLNPACPAVAPLGKTPLVLMTGAAGGLTGKANGAEVTGPGFCTVRKMVPAAALRLAGTAALNWVVEMNVVVRGTGPPPEFHCAIELLAPPTKLVPVIVRVVIPPPAVKLAGFTDPIFGCACELVENWTGAETLPPGSCTVTNAVPG